jgi:hypothetical protein
MRPTETTPKVRSMGHANTGRPLLPLIAWIAAATLGCSDDSVQSTSSLPGENYAARAPQPARPTPADRAKGETPPGEASDATPKAATAGRKIIYNANIDLVTEDLGALESTLGQLVSKQKAYIADSERSGTAGASRHGSWKVRVPVEGYDDFVKGVVALGELVTLKADSQDVSEEYYDIDARQTAKKVEEARLLKHLSESTGKLEEILAVERELSRVRSEIERMQGRLQVLADLTTLATVTITANEIKGYVPPLAPTLFTRIARTFNGSLETLMHFGEALLLLTVAVAPWLPLIALVFGVAIWFSRRSSRRISAIGIRKSTGAGD